MTGENPSRPAYEGGQTIEHNAKETRPTGRGWPLSATIGIGLAAVIGIGAVVAQSAGWGPGGGGHGGWGPGMGARFVEHRIDGVLDDIGASNEQQDKIWSIIDRTRAELRPMHREFRGSRDTLAAILTAPTVDAAALEKLRMERIAAIDEASKKAVASIVEAAQVLTPEQRAKLADEIKDHRSRW